jgi:hypothetical protein
VPELGEPFPNWIARPEWARAEGLCIAPASPIEEITLLGVVSGHTGIIARAGGRFTGKSRIVTRLTLLRWKASGRNALTHRCRANRRHLWNGHYVEALRPESCGQEARYVEWGFPDSRTAGDEN